MVQPRELVHQYRNFLKLKVEAGDWDSQKMSPPMVWVHPICAASPAAQPRYHCPASPVHTSGAAVSGPCVAQHHHGRRVVVGDKHDRDPGNDACAVWTQVPDPVTGTKLVDEVWHLHIASPGEPPPPRV